MNLAPVLDVDRSAGDFDDQYGRSYITSVGAVSALGADFITALQQEGVAATARHFPGLGAATARQSTDDRSVTLKVSQTSLTNTDETPFKSAIASRVKLVMVSCAVYPALARRACARSSQACKETQLWVTLCASVDQAPAYSSDALVRTRVKVTELGDDSVERPKESSLPFAHFME